ncbi:MAG: Dienelactone hydrolase [Chloroflexi bacterium]|nr:Dienelactone hydrolase [Chloroflexota bacterium]
MYETRTDGVKFRGAGGPIQAWISHRLPQDERRPGIVLLHGRNGVNEPFKDVAVRFAEEGIVAMAVNYMTHTDDPSDPDALRTIDGARAYLQSEPDVDAMKVVLSGYCKGGGLTYLGLASRPGFMAGIAWHGGIRNRELSAAHPEHPGEAARNIDVPLLILHGASDHPVPIAQVYELAGALNELGKRFELKVYAGTDHAFTLPGGANYVPENADDAFREAVLFIRRLFDLPVGTVGPLVRQPVGA